MPTHAAPAIIIVDLGIGNDRLFGGTGADQMEGGSGRDTFVIGLRDTLVDFQPGVDQIRIGLPLDIPNPWLIEFLAGLGTNPNDGILIEV